MRFTPLALLLLVGCVSSPVTIEYGIADNAKTMGFGGGGKAVLRKVSIDPEFYGRGCTSVEVSADGGVSILVQSDATSDWIGVRVLPNVVRDAAVAIVGTSMSFINSPMEVLKRWAGVEPTAVAKPSDVGGCHGVLED